MIHDIAYSMGNRADCPKDIKDGIDWYFEMLNAKELDPPSGTCRYIDRWEKHCKENNITFEVYGIVALLFKQKPTNW